jgi:hypothetical protein
VLATDARQPGLDQLGVDPLRRLALEAQQHRLVAAVPLPVAPREPKSSAFTPATRSSSPSSRSPDTKRSAARIGPTVWDDEGRCRP